MSMVSDGSDPYISSQAELSDAESLSSVLTGKESVQHQTIPSKRKSNTTKASQGPVKRKRGSSRYFSGYNNLYNATVEEINCPLESEADLSWKESRIGVSCWSPHEKEAFFVALDRKGQDDIKGVSTFIGTKSESEVRSFILALRDGIGADVQAARPLSEFPAAIEVSEQCDLALDVASLGLLQRQLMIEEDAEKKRHGELWLLNYHISIELDPSPSKEQHLVSQRSLDIALWLFDVPRMTELSTCLFMNSKEPEDNWSTWANDKSGPGLYGTTLVDFYNLVVGITKRIVSSSIFLAKSRHSLQRAAMGKSTHCNIKRRDVQAAIELLGLKKNSRTYWKSMARRCKLDVYEKPFVRATKHKPLSYEEVERYLDDHSRQAVDEDPPPASIDRNLTSIDDIAMTHDGKYLVKEAEDERTELLDAVASKDEEVRLWKSINREPPDVNTIEQKENLTLPNATQDQDRMAKDWRSTMCYRSPWQVTTGTPSERSFDERMTLQARHGTQGAGLSSNDETLPSLSDHVTTSNSDVDGA